MQNRLNTLGWAVLLLTAGATIVRAQTIDYSELSSSGTVNGPAYSFQVRGTGLTGVTFLMWLSPGESPTVFLPVDPGGTDTLFTVTVPAAQQTSGGAATIAACIGSVCGPAISYPVVIYLNSVNPTTILAGSGQPTTVTITAPYGGLTNAQIVWVTDVNMMIHVDLLNKTGSNTDFTVSAILPASLTSTVGTGAIAAMLGPGDGYNSSNGEPIPLLGPTTTSLSRTAATAGDPAFTLTINGSNFATGSGNTQVLWTAGANVTVLTPTSTTSTQVQVQIPATILLAAGTATVAVENFPEETDPVSNSQTFTVYAVPVVMSVAPATTAFNTTTPITVTGNFNAGDQILYNGSALSTTGTATQLQAVVGTTLTNTLGPATIRAVNPAGTQSTTSTTFAVVPQILGLNPASVQAGNPAFLLTVSATGGFLPAVPITVNFNGTSLTGTYVNGTTATATVPAALVLLPGTVPVTVGVPGATSAPFNFSIGNPPSITSVNPNTTPAGSSPTLALVGTNFIAGSVVVFTVNAVSTDLATTYANANSLSAVLPATLTSTAATATITVRNGGSGSPTSNGVAFTVTPATPTLTSVNPNTTPAGSSPTLTLVGTNFIAGSVVVFTVNAVSTDLATTYANANSLSAVLPATLTATAATATITVRNGGSGSPTSNGVAFTVANGGPTLTSVNPNTTPVGSSPTLALVGTNFIAGSVVVFTVNAVSTDLATTYANANSLSAVLPATLTATAGTATITVRNGGSGSPTSNGVAFTVAAATPTLTSVSPNTTPVGSSPTLALVGTNFIAGSVVVFTVNAVSTDLATTYANANSLSAVLPATLTATPATATITVRNGGSGSPTSNGVAFTVAAATPTLTSVSPNTTPVGSSPTLALVGTNFIAGSVVVFTANAVSTDLATTYVNANSLSAVLPATLTATAGTATITVRNGGSGSPTSNGVAFTVAAATPTLTSVSPNTTPVGSSPTLALVGTNFIAGSVVVFTVNAVSTDLATTYANANSLSAVLPATLTVTAATATITVRNGGSGSPTSNGVAFTVAAATPTLTSVSPNTTPVGSSPTLALVGTNFVAGSVVVFTVNAVSTDLATTYANANSLSAVLPATLTATAATATITVRNGGSGSPTSNGVAFTVAAATPTLTSVSPNTTPVGSSPTLALVGTNFVAGSVVVFTVNAVSTDLATTYANANSLSAVLPATLTATAATATITVRNGGSGSPTSNGVAFTVAAATPTLTSVNPNTTPVGSSPTLALVGTNFIAGSVVVFTVNAVSTDLATTYANANSLSAVLPATLTSTAATATITVRNGGSGSPTSNGVAFTVANGGPTLTNIMPSAVTTGDPDSILTLVGTGFKPDASGYTASRVIYTPQGGSALQLAPSSVTPTAITFVLPQAEITTPVTASITVKNVTDNLMSGAVTFLVRPRPLILSLAPNPTATASTATLAISGLNYSATDTIYIGAPACTTSACRQPLATTYNSTTSLGGNLPGTLIPTAGTYSVYVRNDLGAFSQPVPLTVGIQLISLTPSSVNQGAAPPSLVVTSTGGFTANSVVYFGSQALTTVYDTPSQVHAALTASNVSAAGTYPVTVQNPNVGVSNSLPFMVVAVGQISSISPASVFAGSPQITLQVSGSNFAPSDFVRFGTTALTTTYVSAQTLTAIVPASLLTNAIHYPVSVGSSNALAFNVTLQVTSLTPPSVTAGGPAFNLTANLTGGVTAQTVLHYSGTLLATSSFTATSVTAQVPANLIMTPGTPAVYAQDLTYQSNTVNHLVLGALTLVSLAPSFTDAGASGLSLTLTGTGFDSETHATVNGTSVPTTVNSTTGLTAQVPSSLLTTAQSVPVQVIDSQQRTSNSLPLAILTPLSLTSLSPAFAVVGAPQFTLIVSGAGFDTSTYITWTNGTAVTNLSTTYVTPTQVVAVVPAALVAQAGAASIKAADTRGRVSANPLTFTIGAGLTITHLNPSTAMTGTAVNMVITGTGFRPALNSAMVLFGSYSIGVTPVSDTEIDVSVPAEYNPVAGTIPVSVRLGDGRTSNSLAFTSYSGPIITSLTPSAVGLRANGVTLVVSGLYFQPGAVIVVNGASLSTAFISSTQLSAPLPVLTSQGAVGVVVVNPGGVLSNTAALAVGGATTVPATLTSISPSTIAQGSPGFTLAAFGTGFQSGAVIRFGGADLTTTFVSAGQLNGLVPAALVAQAGSIPVLVTNSDGTHTNALAFVVASGRPAITSLNPPTISAGAAAFTLGVTGSGFKSGTVVSFGGISLATAFVSATQLTATVPIGLVRTAGAIPVIVKNPDGLASDPFNFSVAGFALTQIAPSTGNAGGPSFTLALTGTGFVRGASVSFNGSPIATTFTSSTGLTAIVPGSLIAMPGVLPVMVSNPDGAVSNALSYTINSGLTLISINPATIPANSGATAITAAGTGFVQGATIVFNGTPLTTSFSSATSVSGTIPADALTNMGTFNVTVVNPNGGSTNALTFNVSAALPHPVITSVSQTTATAGSAAITLTVAGSGFVQGSSVQFGGSSSATTFVNSTQLRATISAAQLSKGGLFTIVVVNPNGDMSNAVSFSVSTPLSISSLTPSAIPAGLGDQTISIIGSGYVAGATVQFGSNAISANVTSSTQLTVQIPGTLISQSTSFDVTVTNPDGTVSNALALNVVAMPSISVGATITPAGINQVTVTLDNPAPTDLTGTLVLTFQANASNTPPNYIDPAVQFASGGTSISFTISKGAKNATLPGNGVFSPGSVAGTLTLTLTRLIAGIDDVLPSPPPSRSFVISPAAPTITLNSVKIINGTSAGFTVEMTGFSTTREIRSATLTFSTTASIAGGTSFTIDVASIFNNYFSSTAGVANGGTFKLDIPFTISGADANVISAVSVVVANSAGSSSPVSGGR